MKLSSGRGKWLIATETALRINFSREFGAATSVPASTTPTTTRGFSLHSEKYRVAPHQSMSAKSLGSAAMV